MGRRKVSSEDNPALAFDLLGIGRCHLLLKRPHAAVEPLSHALKLREASEDAAEVAAVRFELARALWEAKPEEHERAGVLAEQAREGMPAERQAEVARWLSAHPRPDAGVR